MRKVAAPGSPARGGAEDNAVDLSSTVAEESIFLLVPARPPVDAFRRGFFTVTLRPSVVQGGDEIFTNLCAPTPRDFAQVGFRDRCVASHHGRSYCCARFSGSPDPFPLRCSDGVALTNQPATHISFRRRMPLVAHFWLGPVAVALRIATACACCSGSESCRSRTTGCGGPLFKRSVGRVGRCLNARHRCAPSVVHSQWAVTPLLHSGPRRSARDRWRGADDASRCNG
jgi:hypothetical protein